jgi:hypothetical protein
MSHPTRHRASGAGGGRVGTVGPGKKNACQGGGAVIITSMAQAGRGVQAVRLGVAIGGCKVAGEWLRRVLGHRRAILRSENLLVYK